MSRKIHVLIKDPGKKPRSVNISNTLANLQKTVGGFIETVTITQDCVIICNEEGRYKGLPWNCEICGVNFVGTIIICGVAGDEFADLPLSYHDIKRVMPHLWEERK